ncbi:MAG TPA: hypothetical protein PLK94_10595 [Alphaproteobacteria bacterium]|nr:hypothetical protein [Alphaproteobacteria bacterium]
MLINLKKLKFDKVASQNAPALICNNCGKNDSAYQWHMADIPFDDGSSDHFSIALCSSKCKKAFLRTPGVEEYLAHSLKEAMEAKANLPPQPEFPPEIMEVMGGAIRNVFGDVEIEVERKGNQIFFKPDIINLEQLKNKRDEIKKKIKETTDYFFIYGLSRQLEAIEKQIENLEGEEE